MRLVDGQDHVYMQMWKGGVEAWVLKKGTETDGMVEELKMQMDHELEILAKKT